MTYCTVYARPPGRWFPPPPEAADSPLPSFPRITQLQFTYNGTDLVDCFIVFFLSLFQEKPDRVNELIEKFAKAHPQ